MAPSPLQKSSEVPSLSASRVELNDAPPQRAYPLNIFLIPRTRYVNINSIYDLIK